MRLFQAKKTVRIKIFVATGHSNVFQIQKGISRETTKVSKVTFTSNIYKRTERKESLPNRHVAFQRILNHELSDAHKTCGQKTQNDVSKLLLLTERQAWTLTHTSAQLEDLGQLD